ncbi:CD3337/EF1877 family mobilome membrane protein [Lapidilactobacillus mulanensis]|uniref:CD3337/EF1877 family mobilome membrane protein n=2 Tax=Lactobacillaceae TaxID=33958 RepID=A0ABW4DLE3_9LACO|nr:MULTISPECIES: FUSC family protein [Lactobacillaceae]
MSPRTKRALKITATILATLVILLLITATTASASGLVDETVNTKNEFSKYPVNNYQLDYFVDSSWDWLPWNWGDGIGKSVMYAVYAITNFLWIVSVYLSYATGYLIQQAYSLDFIKDTTAAIGKNMQLLAGVSKNGFSSDGFYPGMLLLLIAIVGVYVAYTGLIKRETSKAISAVVNFVMIFLLSASFIAYSPDYIGKINEFSSDISTSALNTGSKMIMSNKKASSKDGVDAIRDTLFVVQVKQPWTLLQFGDSDPKKVGEKRIEDLVKTDPFKEKGKTRTDLVKSEIEDKDNDNLSAVKTVNRLGVTTFVVLFNIAITIFVFMLTAIMIFSQILFIIYAIFMPISCLLAMIPSFNGLMKTTVMRLFNTVMMRAGITLVLTMAFCLSTMIYSLSATTPFFLVAFLQIVIFGGIWMKLSDLMGMMQLHSSDSQNGASRITRRGNRVMRQLIGNAALGGALSRGLKRSSSPNAGSNEQQTQKRKPNQGQKPPDKRESKKKPMENAGRKVGNLLDTKRKLANTAQKSKDNLTNLPTNTKYGLHQGKENTKKIAKNGIDGFKQGVKNQRQDNQQNRELANQRRREQMKNRKLALTPPNTDHQTAPLPSDLKTSKQLNHQQSKQMPQSDPLQRPKQTDQPLPTTLKNDTFKIPVTQQATTSFKPVSPQSEPITTNPRSTNSSQNKPLNLKVHKPISRPTKELKPPRGKGQ